VVKGQGHCDLRDQNALFAAEAYISTMWRRGSLCLIIVSIVCLTVSLPLWRIKTIKTKNIKTDTTPVVVVRGLTWLQCPFCQQDEDFYEERRQRVTKSVGLEWPCPQLSCTEATVGLM